MGWFIKTAAEYIKEILDLTHKTQDSISKSNLDDAKKFLRLILKFDKKEFLKLDDETGAKELTDKCIYVHVLADEALQSLERGNEEKTEELLYQIIDIQKKEILEKIERYQEIKQELKKRKFDIDKIADGRGYTVDPLIKPLVVTLKYFNIGVDQSCQGHTDHGAPYPWVRIDVNSKVSLDTTFDEFVKTVEEYDLSNRIQWKFKKNANPSEFASSIAIITSDVREFTKEEVEFIMDFCKNRILENKFMLGCGNFKNFQISVTAATGRHHDDLKKMMPLMDPLIKKGYVVSIDIPQEEYHPDTYYLNAEGGSLEEMQRDIMHFSDYIINNFRRPRP